MLISDGLGKVIKMDVEAYLDMTDLEWKEIIASGYGEQIDNPFHDPFSKPTKIIIDDDDIDEIILEELSHIDELDIDLDFEDLEEI